MTERISFRLIMDLARDASMNMAIDEMLVDSQQDAQALPTLRFYAWSAPSVSVGYFQKVSEVARRFGCKEKNFVVVRRLTGGGAVFHGEDLTFSLSIKMPNNFLKGDVKDSYLRINEALRIGLMDCFPGIDYADCKSIPSGRGGMDRVCFEAPSCYDLLMGGRKILGASQRRLRGALLHQSTLFLSKKKEILIPLVTEGFRKKWNIDFNETPLKGGELRRAEKIVSERYATSDWVFNP